MKLKEPGKGAKARHESTKKPLKKRQPGSAFRLSRLKRLLKSTRRDIPKKQFLLRVGPKRETKAFNLEFAHWLADPDRCRHYLVRECFEQPVADFQASLGKKLNAEVLREVKEFEETHTQSLIVELAKFSPYDQLEILNNRISANKHRYQERKKYKKILPYDIQALFYGSHRELSRWDRNRDEIVQRSFGWECARNFAFRGNPGDAFRLHRLAMVFRSDDELMRATKRAFNAAPKLIKRFWRFFLCRYLVEMRPADKLVLRELRASISQFHKVNCNDEHPTEGTKTEQTPADLCLKAVQMAIQNPAILECIQSYCINLDVDQFEQRKTAPLVSFSSFKSVTDRELSGDTEHTITGALGRTSPGRAVIRLCNYLFSELASHRKRGLFQFWSEADLRASAHQLSLIDAGMIDWELEQERAGHTKTDIMNRQEQLAGVADASQDAVRRSFSSPTFTGKNNAKLKELVTKDARRAAQEARLKARYKRRKVSQSK